MSLLGYGKSSSNVVYLMTTPLVKGEYKLGSHTGTKKELKTRYSGAFPHGIIIHRFVEGVTNAAEVETIILNHFVGKRVLHSTTKKESEWITASLGEIKVIIDTYIVKYGKGPCKSNTS